MGMMVVEQQQQQSAPARTDDVVDKKKKRRSNRRSKNHSSLNGSTSIEVAGQHQQAPHNFQNCDTSRSGSASKQNWQNKASNVAFNSLPTLHMNDHEANFDPNMKVFSKSCPTPNMYEGPGGLDDERGFITPYLLDGCNKQKRFDPHWFLDVVKEALQRGEIFQATLRVNAHNRVEAYCTIEGVTTDVLISGVPLQNRAVEGDVVAVKIDPPQIWSKMKGSVESSNTSSPKYDCDPFDGAEISHDRFKGKEKVDPEPAYLPTRNCSPECDNGFYDTSINFSDGTSYQDFSGQNGHLAGLGHLREGCSNVENVVIDSFENLCQAVISFPSKRPTGRVVAIIEPSHRRDAIVGFLDIKWWLSSREGVIKENRRNINWQHLTYSDYIYLTPTDPKFPKMVVLVSSLPDDIRKRLFDGDISVETELVAARIDR